MKRGLIFIYQFLIWLPIIFISTILTAIITTIGCLLGSKHVFSYYPGMIWSKLACIVSLCPVKIIGREKICKKQSYVFVANHQGAFDIFLIYGYLGQPIKWVMKQSLRSIPLVGKACEAAGFIFVDSSSPKAAAKTIENAKKRLIDGASIAIFPEGSRTKTGKMGPFKKGAFQMALDLKLPIVPITINGSYDVMSIHSSLINPYKMEMIIHDPIPTDQYFAENIRDLAANIKTLMLQSGEIIRDDLWNKYSD